MATYGTGESWNLDLVASARTKVANCELLMWSALMIVVFNALTEGTVNVERGYQEGGTPTINA